MIQLQVLNKILADKDIDFLIKNNLNDSYFSDYKDEFKYIQNHLNKYGNLPDLESFLTIFPDFEVLNVKESNRFLLDELFKDYKTRCLALTFNQIRDLLLQNKIDKAVSLYEHSLEDISKNSGVECIDIINNVERYDDYVEKMSDYNKYFIKTGFKELDNLFGGWDRTEELATIIGRTGNGKSWLMLKFAVEAARQGLNVGIYEGEISANKVGFRIDTLLSHISNGKLIHGNESIQLEYKQYIDNLHNLIPGTIKVLTPLNIGGPASVSALKSFILKEGLDILFIDQHSLLEDDRKAKNPIERASNISKDLKNLQVMYKIPIISVSQQNRVANEGGVDTTNISQSDRIGQDSTCVIAIEKKEDIMTLSIIKSRDSESGKKFKYYADFNTGTFTYIPEGDSNESAEETEEENLEQRYSVDNVEGENVF